MTLPESWGRSLVTIQCGYKVDSITFLDHGQLLATSDGFTALDIWDPRTGDCQSSSLPIGHMDIKTLSPDGSLVVSVSFKEMLALWDVAKRENRFDWETRPNLIVETAFSLDSGLVALGYRDGSVQVVDTQTGIDHWNLKDHSNEVTNLAFSPDATMLATSVLDGPIRLWDVRSGSHHSTLGDRVVRFDPRRNARHVMVFSPDSRSIATSFGDHTVQLWSTLTGKYRFELDRNPHGGYSRAVKKGQFSPDSELLATQSFDVFIWDVQIGTCLFNLRGEYDDFSFSPDSNSLALVSFLKVEVWDIQKQTYSVSLFLQGQSVCFSPDGKFLASGSSDGTVRVWDLDTMPMDGCSVGSPLDTASEINHEAVEEVVFSPDGKFVASESSHTIRIWQSETGDCRSEYQGNEPSFSSDGRMVISASENGVRLFDVGANTSRFSPTQDYARFPRLSPDGRLVAAVFRDSIQVWDIQESTIIAIPIRDMNDIHELIFSPTSELIAFALYQDGPHIWNARTGKCITGLSQRIGYPPALAFSPRSELLAFGITGGGDCYLRLWDIKADTYRITLGSNGRCGPAKAIAFAPGGHLVAASFQYHDHHVRLWNIKTGDTLLTIHSFSLNPRVEFLTGMNGVFVDGIDHEIVRTSESPAPEIADCSCHLSDLQIDVSGQWVIESFERVLWLPPEMRPVDPDIYAVWRNKIAIGSRSRLQILTFDDEPNHSGIEELSLGSGD